MELLSFFLIEHSENESITQFGLVENQMRLGVFQSSIKEHTCCNNAKGTKRRPFTMFQPCPTSLEFLQVACLLNTGLQHSRSNFVFEIENNFILECSIACSNNCSNLSQLF